MITRSAIVYIATMVAGAVILALAGGVWPALREGGFMPLFILLALSLAYDVAVMQFGARFEMSPLSMGQRMTGFMSGAILFIMLNAALAGKPLV